ncbi:DUF4142 domain-containing protein [Streptosporangium carneum]|uniref:DUF4142 domain-containing protein n=1 Tax=Streptosporangium carneum TaxID=47481 RepID=A0A9W6I6E7_9ACTN|nr:DUF4142 domain-containing protein [Streptosporangium carneum]GLK12261.1 hypothetical protein GCM10017600_56700 [Streptosporangium carneum]
MIRRIMVLLTVVFVVVGGTTTGALAQPELNEQDKKFLVQAHRSNLAEILSAKLAERKSSNDTLKDIAQKLITDHTKLDDAVKQAAQKAGVELPQQPGPKQRAALEALARLDGAAFDTGWVRAQIAGHRQTLSNINNELQDGSSAEVKKLASEAKPIVQGHLEMLEKARGGGGGGNGGGGGGEEPSPQSTPTGGVTPSGMPTG